MVVLKCACVYRERGKREWEYRCFKAQKYDKCFDLHRYVLHSFSCCIFLCLYLQKDTSSAMAKHSGAHLDLAAFSSAEELMSLGLDRLKSALMALGLKCGG